VRIAIAVPVGGLLAGCALGLHGPNIPDPIPVVCLIASLVVVLAGYSRRDIWFAIGITGGFAAGGALLASRAWDAAWRPSLRVAFESIALNERDAALVAGRSPPEDDSASVVLVGVLLRDASPTATGAWSLPVAVEWVGRARSMRGDLDAAANPVAGGVLITVAGALAGERASEWRAGRSIRMSAQIHRPARYLNYEVMDQERTLARRGVTLVGTVKSAALVEVTARGHPLAEAAASLRAFARRAVASTVGRWSPRSAGIVTAIVLGDRSGLNEAVERRLQEAGTYHVIAISGGNIAILAGLTLTAFRVVGLLGRVAMGSAIAALIAYAYLVGNGASVDRATLMAVVFFLGRAIDLRGPPLHTLVLAAGVLVLNDPLAIGDPGFLLTFGATAAILIAAPQLPLRRLRRLLVPVAAMLVASASAEAALFPVGATLFSRVTFAGLALNFLAIPLMAVAQIAGMLVVPVFAVAPLAAVVIGWIAHLGADGLVRSADLVQIVPMVTWRVAPPAPLALAVYYIGGTISWVLWTRYRARSRSSPSVLARRMRLVAGAAALGATGWILVEPWTWLTASGDGRLHVTFIDVGQGDSALIRFPHGSTLLVDAGGLGGSPTFDMGDRVVAPVLRGVGVRRLNALALTHGDVDHVGGADAIVREFRPREVWEGIPVPRSPVLRTVAIAAGAAGALWRNVQTDDRVRVDEVTVIVRHPNVAEWDRQRVRNDDSIVLELLWRDVSIVLAGDVGADAEQAMASRFRPARLRVIKVPHHGSATSSSDTFVRALRPRAAVVSVGRRNTFGHPAPAVLARYEAIGAAIFRTDRDGAITVDTDGWSLNIRTFVGRSIRIDRSPSHEDTKARRN
jgi:competence protein ComEC